MYSKRNLTLFIICALVAISLPANSLATEQQSNWRLCGDEIKTPLLSDEVKVYVPECPAVNGTDTRCLLRKGTEVQLKIEFKSKEKVSELERIIVARVPLALTGKHAEMPYGPSISPCENATLVATDDNSECVDGGVDANKMYTHVSMFKVLKSFPTVKDIEVRFILRKKLDKHRKLRLYRKHPGPIVYCVVVSNVEVVDESADA